MKSVTDIATQLISGTTKTQKFISILLIIIAGAGYLSYLDYNKTEIEIHEIHEHTDTDTDTVYLPTPSKPGDHHWDILKTGNTREPSKSQERIASRG